MNREQAIAKAKEFNKDRTEEDKYTFVAMDENGSWCAYIDKPDLGTAVWNNGGAFTELGYGSDWQGTLTEIGE